MLDKLRQGMAPFGKIIGIVVTALVLIFFWHPIMHFLQEILTKADGLFGK